MVVCVCVCAVYVHMFKCVGLHVMRAVCGCLLHNDSWCSSSGGFKIMGKA